MNKNNQDNVLGNKHRPLNFDSYVGQLGITNYIKSIIQHNRHPSGIVISGNSGVGKTSLAKLYMRATLCENREENSFEPCGICDICVSDTKISTANIYEYTISEASSFKEIVGDIVSIAKSAPVLTSRNPRDDNTRRFICIDEVQNSTRQSISPFLDSLEFAHNKVTTILISMDLSKIDPTVKDAIESRCIELNLDKLADKEICDNLCSYYPNLNIDSAKLIAYLASGNMRKAWSNLQYFLSQMSVKDISAEVIYNHKLGGLSPVFFSNLINSLEAKTWKDTCSLIKNNSIDSITVDLLLKYLVKQELTDQGIALVSSLSNWYQCTYRAPLVSIILPYQGKLLIAASESRAYEGRSCLGVNQIHATVSHDFMESTKNTLSRVGFSIPSKFKRGVEKQENSIETLDREQGVLSEVSSDVYTGRESNSPEGPSGMIATSILQQASNILGAKVELKSSKKPLCFVAKSWLELLNYYAISNYEPD